MEDTAEESKQTHWNSCRNARLNKKKGRPIKFVTEHEWWVFIGILISAGATGKGGKTIYETDTKKISEGKRIISPSLNYNSFMPQRRFEILKPIFHFAFTAKERSNASSGQYDPYYPIVSLVESFNHNRNKVFAASVIKVHDESISLSTESR